MQERHGWIRRIAAKALIAASVGLLLGAPAKADEQEEVCVKYKKEYGWSKGYAVKATVISGSDLNAKVGSYTRFKAFSTYAVIFWGEDQATILELPSLSMGSVPIFENEVKDQQERVWKVKQGHDFCH